MRILLRSLGASGSLVHLQSVQSQKKRILHCTYAETAKLDIISSVFNPISLICFSSLCLHLPSILTSYALTSSWCVFIEFLLHLIVLILMDSDFKFKFVKNFYFLVLWDGGRGGEGGKGTIALWGLGSWCRHGTRMDDGRLIWGWRKETHSESMFPCQFPPRNPHRVSWDWTRYPWWKFGDESPQLRHDLIEYLKIFLDIIKTNVVTIQRGSWWPKHVEFINVFNNTRYLF
jgi:hypothetical protein